MKVIYLNWGQRREYESDLRSNEHYLSSSENKAWKKIHACTGFEPMTSAIPVQRSTNWANKPTIRLFTAVQICEFHISKIIIPQNFCARADFNCKESKKTNLS